VGGDDKNAHCDVPDSEKEPANGGKPMAWPRTRDDTQANRDTLEILEIVGAAIRAWSEMKKRDTAEYDRERLMHDEQPNGLTPKR